MRQIDEKAARLISKGRVIKMNTEEDAYRVVGDSGMIHGVFIGAWGGTCTCESGKHTGQLKLSSIPIKACSHLRAALYVSYQDNAVVRAAIGDVEGGETS